MLEDYEGSVDAFANAIALRRTIGDARGLHKSVSQLARTHDVFDRDALAAASRIEAADLAGQLGDTEKELFDRKKAAGTLSLLGRHREAIEQLHLAREPALESGEAEHLVSVEQRIGAALSRSGQYTAAAEQARTAVELATQNDLPAMEAVALVTLAKALLSTGQLTDALLAEQRAYELRHELESPEDELYVLNNLAAIHRRLGDSDAAKRYMQDALAFARELVEQEADSSKSRELLSLALNGMGVVLADEGRYQEALAHQRESLLLRESSDDLAGIAHARMNLADLLWTMGRREESANLAGQAVAGFREVADPGRLCLALTLQADLLRRQGRQEQALESCAEALELARSHGLRKESRYAHTVRAAVYEEYGRPAEALEELRLALDLIDAQREEMVSGEFKMRFLAPVMEVYERAVSLQARLEPERGASGEQAFRLVERARARSLLDLLTESSSGLRRLLPPDVMARELGLIDEVGAAATRMTALADSDDAAHAAAELASAREELDRFKVELRKQAPEYSQLAYPQPVELRAVQQDVLREDETLLRYFFGAGRALLWIVDRQGAELFDLGDPARIESLVAEFLDRAGRSGTGLSRRPAGQASAEKLAQALGVSSIPAGRRLLVVPDGPLYRLPFEALRHDGRYLVQDHEVSLVPSATALSVLRSAGRRHAADGFLGLGDPLNAKGDESFPELPATGQALTRIAELFPRQGRVTLERETCTKEALRAQPLEEFRFVHFATHGWWDPSNPRRIGLRLSPSSEAGGADFLYVDDVFQLDLGAELVVLAGCQTGLGELLPGEGLVGLTRAFLSAGARSVLVSLWNVSDKSTAEFMEAFYRELDGRTIPDALRRARLSFITSDRPAQRQYYRWAPFVLIGDPGTATLSLNRGQPDSNP
jgi:tetratricopeptide (TPR) repeat protein